MFTIYGGKTEFNQWEQGQMITNPNMAVGDKVRFWNASGETHPMIAYKHDGVVVVDVPNDLLQRASPILVDLCGKPEYLTRFMVNFVSHKEPEGYQYIDNTHCEPVVPAGEADLGDLVVSVGGDNLTWDGNTDGLLTVDTDFGPMYKVSNVVPTIDDFANGVKIVSNNGTVEVIDGKFIEVDPYGQINLNPTAFFVTEEAVGKDIDGVTFTEAGLYCAIFNGFHVTSLTIPGFNGFVKEQINRKYIAEYVRVIHINFGPSPDGGTESVFYRTDTGEIIEPATLKELIASNTPLHLSADVFALNYTVMPGGIILMIGVIPDGTTFTVRQIMITPDNQVTMQNFFYKSA